jgi:acetyltransferase-like isoleucine patch superfamily enzyme
MRSDWVVVARKIVRPFVSLTILASKVFSRLWMYALQSQFRSCGRNVHFGRGCQFSYSTISLGHDVYIGPGATFMSALSRIEIGNKVLFGPNVTIMGGNHRTDLVGAYMYDVTEKLPDNDRDVIIEDDVWVGCNAIILKGVRIGRGSIIGAGSVVVKSVPPYTVYVGSPGLKTKARWDAGTIADHERILAAAGNEP